MGVSRLAKVSLAGKDDEPENDVTVLNRGGYKWQLGWTRAVRRRKKMRCQASFVFLFSIFTEARRTRDS